MATEHTRLLCEILASLGSRPGVRLWRNDVGVAKSLDNKRTIKFGLKGSADILGIGPGGVFIAIEIKVGKDKLRDSQKVFRDVIKSCGGCFIEARSVEQCVDEFTEFFSKMVS